MSKPPKFKPSKASTNRPLVALCPGTLGGDPRLHNHRLATAFLAGNILAGMTVDQLATMYSIRRKDVLVCCWYEARYGSRRFRAHWKAWLADNEPYMRHGTWKTVVVPPARPT